MTATLIAALALIVSVSILVVQYRNQIERRHGEIVQLKTQTLAALSSVQRGFASVLMNAEIVRIEVRRVRDSDSKYNIIERLPPLLRNTSAVKTEIDGSLKFFEELETQTANRSAILLQLQTIAGRVQNLVPRVQEMENEMLGLLTNIRKKIEAGETTP
jgi:hypothetical protein